MESLSLRTSQLRQSAVVLRLECLQTFSRTSSFLCCGFLHRNSPVAHGTYLFHLIIVIVIIIIIIIVVVIIIIINFRIIITIP